MNCTEARTRLDAHLEGNLSATAQLEIEAHLASCAACRGELTSLETLLASARALPREIAPARDLWPGLAAALRRELAPRPAPIRWLLPLAVAASAAFTFTLVERAPRPTWAVAALAGAPQIDAKDIRAGTALRLGQWLETDETSRARLHVGAIGELNVEPNSRLRLTGVGAADHRVHLARGELHALIWAPPRLFFVDTPSARAIDLGCSYTLKVDAQGNGELRVLTGYVALEHGHRESIIPAGLMCLTRPRAGPGTPFVEHARAEFRAALTRFDFEGGVVADLLPLAGRQDAVTLWHLLSRANTASRGAIFDLLAAFYAPPTGVTREGIVRGDARMRAAWADVLALNPLTSP